MASNKQDSSSNAKILIAFISITSILGLWMVFASKTQREASIEQTLPQPVVSGEIYFPEIPTLVPMVDVNQQMADTQPEQPVQELRNVAAPTIMVQKAAPQVGIQSIVVGSSSSGGGSTSSSQTTSQTNTGTS